MNPATIRGSAPEPCQGSEALTSQTPMDYGTLITNESTVVDRRPGWICRGVWFRSNQSSTHRHTSARKLTGLATVGTDIDLVMVVGLDTGLRHGGDGGGGRTRILRSLVTSW